MGIIGIILLYIIAVGSCSIVWKWMIGEGDWISIIKSFALSFAFSGVVIGMMIFVIKYFLN